MESWLQEPHVQDLSLPGGLLQPSPSSKTAPSTLGPAQLFVLPSAPPPRSTLLSSVSSCLSSSGS